MPTATLTRPTRKQYVDYMGSLKGAYGPGKGLANNDNPFNTWYYGRRVSGNNYAWCAVTECYVENHFNILAINGGKVAYVPNMVPVARSVGAKVWHKPSSVPKQGTSWAKPGNKLCYDFNRTGEAEHTGTFIRRLSATTFLSRDGNTESGKGSDVLDDKPRSVHDVLDCIELLGVADSGSSLTLEDLMDLPYVSLGMSKPQKVKAGEHPHAIFDIEYGDADKDHAGDGKGAAKDAYPGILSGGKKKTIIWATVEVPAEMGTWRLIEVDPAHDYKVTKPYPIRKGPFTETGKVEPNQHLYVELHPTADGEVTVAVKVPHLHIS